MSGAGRKVFQPGEVLTASNVQNYLQDQAVMVFAGTAARGTALGAGTVTNGMMSYLQDTNTVEVYKTTGTAISGWEAPYPISPNVIINGAFDVWQRGTASSGNVYLADRWFGGNSPSAMSRSTDVPNGFTYSLDITGANHLLGNRIESINSTPLYGQNITVSFYAKSSSGTNTLTLQIGTPSTTDNFATSNVEYTSSAFTISSSWTRYTATFPALSSSILKGAFIYIFRNGSTATDRTLITGVQLEAGQTATPFRRNANSIQGELAACQRYYWRNTATVSSQRIANGHQANTTTSEAMFQFPVEMRATPAFAASNIYWTDSTSFNATVTGYSSPYAGNKAAGVYVNYSAAGSTAKPGYISAINIGSYVEFSAEL